MSESDNTLWEIDKEVLRYVEAHPDCTQREVVLGVTDQTQHTAIARLRRLVRGGFVRMKDDDVGHQWLYRRTQHFPGASTKLAQGGAPSGGDDD